ncbi:hypothetical protein [Streptomyces sp. NPDC058475]
MAAAPATLPGVGPVACGGDTVEVPRVDGSTAVFTVRETSR